MVPKKMEKKNYLDGFIYTWLAKKITSRTNSNRYIEKKASTDNTTLGKVEEEKKTLQTWTVATD